MCISTTGSGVTSCHHATVRCAAAFARAQVAAAAPPRCGGPVRQRFLVEEELEFPSGEAEAGQHPESYT